MYTFDLRKLLRRYSPTWFRWAENQSMAYALCSRLATIAAWFGLLRAEVADEWRYNGLEHSLTTALNDRFDPVQRRIWITPQPQVPYLFYRSAEEPPVQRFGSAGDPLSHYYMDAQQLAGALAYPHEFSINVPTAIGVASPAIFRFVDLYRFAGRRPRYIRRGAFNAIERIDYYDEFALHG